MPRIRCALAAIVLLAVSCGSSDTDDLLNELGISEQEAACLTREFEARDLDVDKLLRADDSFELSDDERTGRADAAAQCAEVSTDEEGDAERDDTADDTDSENASAAADDTDDDLSPLEQALIDTLEAEGLDPAAGRCLLVELEAAGFSLTDLMALGLDENAEPDPAMIAAVLRCGDEIVEAGLMDLGGVFGGGAVTDPSDDVDTYGDDIELDRLWDLCASGDQEACDELFWLSPIDSEYEMFGSTCGLTTEPTTGGCATTFANPEAFAYGDDPRLDALYDSCANGDMIACDDLYWESPIDSEYETFGRSCGGELEANGGGSCAETQRGSDATYGDDPRLDALYDSCADGDMAACDQLYWESPIFSEYETFGNLCGGRSESFLFGDCEATFG